MQALQQSAGGSHILYAGRDFEVAVEVEADELGVVKIEQCT
jgi:hypothetical protein